MFQEFAGWASNDWLGTSAVSEGGAFFFSQNSGGNSTALYVPVNQTGTYAVLMHNTLFHGESLYEPVTVEAKFSTLLPDSTPPRIALGLPGYVGGRLSVPVAIEDANPAGFSYSMDGKPVPLAGSDLVLDGEGLAEGPHLLTVESADTVGHKSVFASEFIVDRTPPTADISVLYENGTSTAATVASKGSAQYDIYNNSTKYRLAGMAPGAKILPVKALWAGDTIYGWLYASGFDQQPDGKWRYAGAHKADIISNSWGIPNFPLLKYGPGYDVLSVFSSTLVVPDLLAKGYLGTVIVDSAGNNGVGYGSVGAPNTSPFSISVGATTNNVHLQYGPFANITRFGPSAAAYDDVAEFSSRGPGIFGDPKPELMAVGSYGFTPADVTVKVLQAKNNDANNDGAFALFGGTSMAAPMVAGAAALLVGDMKDRDEPVNPFEVKSLLMSTAKDLKNDPFVQGSGRVDALAAIELARGKDGRFSA